MEKPKFVIVSPRPKNGGPIVLHAMCKYIKEEGYDARILYIGPNVYKKHSKLAFWILWFSFNFGDSLAVFFCKLFKFVLKHFKKLDFYVNPIIKGCKKKFWPFVDDNTIVVYPEIVYGNFLKAKNVVRYLLSFYNYSDDKDAYGEKDLFICYRKIFNNIKLNPNELTFNFSYFNLGLYKQTNFGEREGNCYIIRKGKNREDLPRNFDGPIIDNFSEEKIAKTFNKCKYCISYDTQTAYTTLAAICGCIPIVVLEKGKTRTDYCKDEEIYGVAYGSSESEIDYAIKTRNLARETYEKLNLQAKEQAKKFVELCKQKFE